jgi:deoxyribodipyrimidine photo-lyase
MIDEARVQQLNTKSPAQSGGPVVYWMQADQRAQDNWALAYAIEQANVLGVSVVVAFVVHTKLGNAYVRHYDFMLRGLVQTAQRLRAQGVGFVMRAGDPIVVVPALVQELGTSLLVTDQSYLRWGTSVRRAVAERVDVRMDVVDGHTIVPPQLAYPKACYGAYILRPKLRALRERFITTYPDVRVRVPWTGAQPAGLDERDVAGVMAQLDLDGSVGPVEVAAGSAAALAQLRAFIDRGFKVYDDKRNDPVADVTSQLSAYVHFGQISAQRIAYEVLNSEAYEVNPEGGEGYLDELITWRELAINHALYNEHYDSYGGIPAWAQLSLEKHAGDPREWIYSTDQLEASATHDELWNAAQRQMVRTGRMHGYMRMYWAKKILEWSENAAAAIQAAIYLNDKYLLDGRDANGYAGILWAIGGLHDRPWYDRPIYGQVRYMSYGGAKGKFDVDGYIRAVGDLR